jgi:hypothetical protein
MQRQGIGLVVGYPDPVIGAKNDFQQFGVFHLGAGHGFFEW